MENVSEAVIMAGQMLIFIVALSICMSSLTIVRVEIDRIIGRPETVQMAKGTEGYINYLESDRAKATRKVGVETVASSMYRSIKENYVVYVVLANQSDYISNANLRDSEVDTVEVTKDISINGTQIITSGQKIIKTTIGHGTNQDINEKLQKGLYTYLKEKNFYEYLGEYQNSTLIDTPVGGIQGADPENKQTYRIITYIEESLISI